MRVGAGDRSFSVGVGIARVGGASGNRSPEFSRAAYGLRRFSAYDLTHWGVFEGQPSNTAVGRRGGLSRARDNFDAVSARAR